MVLHQRSGHQLQEVALVHARGDVHAHLQVHQTQVLPLMQLFTCGIQYPATQFSASWNSSATRITSLGG